MSVAAIKHLLNWATQKLRAASSSPALDSEVLLCHVLKIERGWLYANPEYQLSTAQYSKFKILISKRARFWPVAYLTSHKEFMGLDFKVTPDVLIPRPETETLVERALSLLSSPQAMGRGQERGRINIIDLGTGSGNIIVSLAVIARNPSATGGRRRSNPNFFALDSSSKALQIAKLNARRHGVSNKIKFIRGNLLDPLFHLPLMRGRISGGRSTLILANLPYLIPSEYRSNPDLKHEPRSALVGGKDGLKYYRKLFKQVSRHCEESGQKSGRRSNPNEIATRPSGARNDRLGIILLLEHSPTQKRPLQKLVQKILPFARLTFHKDLAGKYRVMEIRICIPSGSLS